MRYTCTNWNRGVDRIALIDEYWLKSDRRLTRSKKRCTHRVGGMQINSIMSGNITMEERTIGRIRDRWLEVHTQAGRHTIFVRHVWRGGRKEGVVRSDECLGLGAGREIARR